jgi:hypothetical protein
MTFGKVLFPHPRRCIGNVKETYPSRPISGLKCEERFAFGKGIGRAGIAGTTSHVKKLLKISRITFGL